MQKSVMTAIKLKFCFLETLAFQQMNKQYKSEDTET